MTGQKINDTTYENLPFFTTPGYVSQKKTPLTKRLSILVTDIGSYLFKNFV